MLISMAKGKHRNEYEIFCKLLHDLRVDAGIVQTALAKKLGKPQQFVSRYESGERRIDVVELRVICRALGMSLAEFSKKLEEAIVRAGNKN